MKVKIYEEVGLFNIWFFIAVGTFFLVALISLISNFNIWGFIFYLALMLGSFSISFFYIRKRKRGELVETIIKCEKIEEIQEIK